MSHTGVLQKMRTENGTPIQYFLQLGADEINVNSLLEKELHLHHEGEQCLSCGESKKIYRQGNCYECFWEQPNLGDWIMRPELSKAHLGIEDRNLEYEKEVQLKPHIVYLALSSDVKVGVTRKTQVPTRWIDQGANAAIPILEAPNRYLAGITEVALKDYVADKTNWRKMLKNEVPKVDLIAIGKHLAQFIPTEAQEYVIVNNAKLMDLDFPVLQYPQKIKSLNLTKTPDYKGKLVGIKGQYFIFEDNTVYNIRGNEGTVISLNY